MIGMSDVAMEIENMIQWCLENYDNGADTMVECWSRDDYFRLITVTCDLDFDKAWDHLKSLASIYRERQADAAYHRSVAG